LICAVVVVPVLAAVPKNLQPSTLNPVAVAAVKIQSTTQRVAVLVTTSQLTNDTYAPVTLIIAVIASSPAVNITFSIVTLAPLTRTLAQITPLIVIFGLSDPSHNPFIVTPALLIVRAEAVATVSVCQGATNITSPLFAVHAANAAVIVEYLLCTHSSGVKKRFKKLIFELSLSATIKVFHAVGAVIAHSNACPYQEF
jgi:hypothetical protein